MSYPREDVLCVATKAWELGLIRQSNLAGDLKSNGVLLNRQWVEDREDYLQIIPYIVLRNWQEIFCYNRKGNESGLLGLMSIGVGGHLNSNSYYQEAQRELKEETGLDIDSARINVECIIRTDDEVGKYHLGVLHILDILREDLKPSEEISNGIWVSIGYLELVSRNNPDKLESWSRIAIDAGYLKKDSKDVAK